MESSHKPAHLHHSFLSHGRPHALDWCFGLFKRHYCQVGSLKAIAQAVNDSADCNFAQLVSDENGGTTYDWTDFFAPHVKKVAGIKKDHHFQYDASQPGAVFVKEHGHQRGKD